jgi:hypothetical protein
MVTIPSHKGNTNQNDIEISSHCNQKGYHQENKEQMLVRMQGEKKPLYTVGGNVN